MVGKAKAFKGLIKKAVGLDVCRQRCLASLCGLHRQLANLQGQNLVQGASAELADLEEACPICRLAFGSRLAWASHVAKVHGYRCHSCG